MKNLLIAVNGFLMALADSVPGVSGGTIAFIMGIYDKFIASLSALTGKDNSARKDALIFLIKLGIGWVIGFAVAVTVLAALFTEKIYWVSSLFMGFIIFSIPLVVKEEKSTLSESYVKALYAIPGIALVVLITLFNPVGGGSGLDLSAPSAAEYIFL
ncbi:MAG: undecaprenyl phosphate translocase family protein, partial [Oscillospiraceae bacterium]